MSEAFVRLRDVVARLRAPDGCPWDREQTNESLMPPLIEEAYEVASAIRTSDDANLCEELGDLVDGEAFLFRRDLGMHDDKQEQIAQLLAQVRVVPGADRPGHLISFVHQRRNERCIRLFAVPRTAVGFAQFCDDLAKLREVNGDR